MIINDLWGKVVGEMREVTLKWREKRVSGRREVVKDQISWKSQERKNRKLSLVILVQ